MDARTAFRWCLACASAATLWLLRRSTDAAETALLAQAAAGQALAAWGEASGDWAARQVSHALFVGTATAGVFYGRQRPLLAVLAAIFAAREAGKAATGVCLFEHDIEPSGGRSPESAVMHCLFLFGLGSALWNLFRNRNF